jgi:hypothetical protein
VLGLLPPQKKMGCVINVMTRNIMIVAAKKFLLAILLFQSSYIATASLPTYSYSLSNPSDGDYCGVYLVLRLYDLYDQINSFQMPDITIHFTDGTAYENYVPPYKWSYNYSDPISYYGQITYGEDQYAVYYYGDLTHINNTISGISVSGVLPRVSYMNMKYEYESYTNGNCPHKSKIEPSMLIQTTDLSDFEYNWDGGSNPYIVGDTSTVGYYTSQDEEAKDPSHQISSDKKTMHTEEKGDAGESPLNVYRLDVALSKLVQPDGHSDTKCSASYLFANLYNNPEIASCEKPDFAPMYNYAVMKVTIPYAFNVYDDNEITFNDYDVRYFSVSSHLCNKELNNSLPFWTVNTRMMANFLNATALEAANEPFYLFFAPIEDVQQYVLDNDPDGLLDKSTPPPYEWGIYKGFLLAIPDFSFIFRYRISNANWAGNPNRSPCYDSPRANQPVSNIDAEWIPEIFGDNFDSFDEFENADMIGPIKSSGGGW